MSALYYLTDFDKSRSFVVLRATEGQEETAATFNYNAGNKKFIKRIASVFVWIMNL